LFPGVTVSVLSENIPFANRGVWVSRGRPHLVSGHELIDAFESCDDCAGLFAREDDGDARRAAGALDITDER
jgi:hypothetical protein